MRWRLPGISNKIWALFLRPLSPQCCIKIPQALPGLPQLQEGFLSSQHWYTPALLAASGGSLHLQTCSQPPPAIKPCCHSMRLRASSVIESADALRLNSRMIDWIWAVIIKFIRTVHVQLNLPCKRSGFHSRLYRWIGYACKIIQFIKTCG